MGDKIIPIRPGKRRRPVWFDVEDRERLTVRLSIVFRGIWQSVQEIQKEYPPTGFGKKALQAATVAENAGGLFYYGEDFTKAIRRDTIGLVIKEIYIDNNAWIENLWYPVIVEFKGKLLWDTLTPDPRSKEKWNSRLLVCGKKWIDVSLGQDTVVRVTARLCDDILGQSFSEQALEKRFIGWRKRTREKR